MDNPEILWAQSREKVFITLNIEGINEQMYSTAICSCPFAVVNHCEIGCATADVS